jgi:16S rRNA (adenine1518-N6/adenine1519-N6)-dimethyltransferase
MTENLVANGSPVYAVELDPPLISGLQRLAKQFPNLTVVPGDILELDLAALAAGRRLRIYGNLPYYITSPILQRLFSLADSIDEIHIVIQHEVALRLAAKPGTSDYGYLSVLTQYFSRPDIALEIPREAFAPPPEVESALVSLRFPGARAKLKIPNEDTFFDFVKTCFAKKRKTLVNNLRSLNEPEAVRDALARIDLRPDARAEQLNVAQLAELQRQLCPPPLLT